MLQGAILALIMFSIILINNKIKERKEKKYESKENIETVSEEKFTNKNDVVNFEVEISDGNNLAAETNYLQKSKFYCMFCGFEIPEYAKFCRYCGKEVDSKYLGTTFQRNKIFNSKILVKFFLFENLLTFFSFIIFGLSVLNFIFAGKYLSSGMTYARAYLSNRYFLTSIIITFLSLASIIVFLTLNKKRNLKTINIFGFIFLLIALPLSFIVLVFGWEVFIRNF